MKSLSTAPCDIVYVCGQTNCRIMHGSIDTRGGRKYVCDYSHAMEIVEAYTPGILICEMDADGDMLLKLCRAVRANACLRHMGIVAILSEGTDPVPFLKAGASIFLDNPSQQTLNVQVESLMRDYIYLYEYISSNGCVANSYSKSDSLFLAKLNELLYRELSNGKLDVEYIAKRLNMSSSNFYRRVKRLTCKTPNEYLTDIRMERAKALLLMNESDIAQVSLAVGYCSHSYFSLCFKKHFGMTPKEYILRNESNEQEK